MNSIFVLALCLTAVLAAPQLHDPNHYAQHAQSVQLARQGQAARLENLEGSNTQQVVTNDLCGLCSESKHSESDLSHATSHGVGIVYNAPSVVGSETSSSTSETSSSSIGTSGQVYAPVGADSTSELHTSSSQTENVGVNTVAINPVVTGGHESYTHDSSSTSSSSSPAVAHVVYSPSGSSSSQSFKEHNEQYSETAAPVHTLVYSPAGGSETFSQASKQVVQSGSPSLTVYSPVGGGSESHFKHQSSESIQSLPTPIVPVFSPSSGKYESYDHRVRETVQSAPTPVVTYVQQPSSSSKVYHHEKIVNSNAAPLAPVFVPSTNQQFTASRFSDSGFSSAPLYTYSPSSQSSFSKYRNQHIQQQQQLPVAVMPIPTGGSSIHSSRMHSHVSQQASPTVIVPTYGGGHSVHTEDRFAEIKSTPVTPLIFNAGPSGQSHSSLVQESHSTNQVAPQILYHSAPSGQFSSQRLSSASQNLGGNFGVLSYPSQASASSQFREESSSSAGNFGSTVGGIVYPSLTSSRFNSDSGFSSGVSSDLHQYMTESERLARLQAQNIQSSSDYKASSAANFGAVHPVPIAAGGHTKSWEKSSKWASESEYDQTGTTKSKSFITTAEGEDETINGRSSGYRAATSTVDNDGKRSTYSVHSP